MENIEIEQNFLDDYIDNIAKKKAENEDRKTNECCEGCRYANKDKKCSILNKVYRPDEKPCPFKKAKDVVYDYVLRTALEGKNFFNE